jgi:hypothetical protein
MDSHNINANVSVKEGESYIERGFMIVFKVVT